MTLLSVQASRLTFVHRLQLTDVCLPITMDLHGLQAAGLHGFALLQAAVVSLDSLQSNIHNAVL